MKSEINNVKERHRYVLINNRLNRLKASSCPTLSYVKVKLIVNIISLKLLKKVTRRSRTRARALPDEKARFCNTSLLRPSGSCARGLFLCRPLSLSSVRRPSPARGPSSPLLGHQAIVPS